MHGRVHLVCYRLAMYSTGFLHRSSNAKESITSATSASVNLKLKDPDPMQMNTEMNLSLQLISVSIRLSLKCSACLESTHLCISWSSARTVHGRSSLL